MAGLDGSNWRQRLKTNRVDGGWIKVTRYRNGRYYGLLTIEGKKVALPMRTVPGLAAGDVDR